MTIRYGYKENMLQAERPAIYLKLATDLIHMNEHVKDTNVTMIYTIKNMKQIENLKM